MIAARQPPVQLQGLGKAALERGRDRLLLVAVMFMLGFAALGARLIGVAGLDANMAAEASPDTIVAARPGARADIVDRRGELLATNLVTKSLYADPRMVRDPDALALALATLLPELDVAQTRARLAANGRFVWLRRGLVPRHAAAVLALGEPALGFIDEQRRVYPQGRLPVHLVGYTDIDNRGIAGIERRFDEALRADPDTPLRLSLDMRFQHVLREELAAAVAEFRPIGAAGVILDAETGETLAMVSLPDFDPNQPIATNSQAQFNRATLGLYEMGSTFKPFTVAMALESGAAVLGDTYDATHPLRLSRFTIHDFHAQGRPLSVSEVLVHSSNIGAALMALDVGTERQRAYLERFGMLTPSTVELPEVARPLMPATWREINTATIGFGHGLAVSPMQLANATAALVNGGLWRPATVLARDPGAFDVAAQIISPETSAVVRDLLRRVVTEGTGGNADVAGFAVGGKTGSAEKAGPAGYDGRRLVSSFLAAFPIDAPKFVVLVVLDEPKGHPGTHGYATGGWVAAPVVARVVERIAPVAGLSPRPVTPSWESVEALLVKLAPAEAPRAAF